MYKLILIEDDLPVLRSLEKTIREHSTTFEVCKAFSNPQDAIDYIDNNHVDAIITDIKLPQMSGIEVCEYCYNHHPKIVFAIFSAYDYFEYTKKAIEFEVAQYILKPITLPKIENALSRLSQKLSKLNVTEGFMDIQDSLSRQSTISNLLSGLYDSYDDFFVTLSEYGVVTDYDSCRCATIELNFDKADNHSAAQTHHSKEQLLQVTNTVINRNNKKYFSILFSSSAEQFCIYVFSKQPFSEQEYKSVIKTYMHELISDLGSILKINITSHHVELYKTIEDFTNRRKKYISCQEQAINIMSYVYSGELQRAKHCIETLPIIYKNDTQIVLTIYRHLYEHLKKLLKCNIDFDGDIASQKQTLSLLLNDIGKNNRRQAYDDDVMTNALDFIHENFSKDITLNDVANHVFLNQFYFSTYFKKKTGEKYIDYISNLKIKKAKELLENTDTKLHYVAEESGFRDTNYFHKAFRAATGLTPLEYRNKYRSK